MPAGITFHSLAKEDVIRIYWCTSNNSGPCLKVLRNVHHKPVNTKWRHGFPALNLYTSLNEHLYFISWVWKRPSHPVIVEKCVYFSPALFLASFSLSLPLIAIYSTGPLVRSHSEKKINAVENKKPGYYTRLKPIMSVPTIKVFFSSFTCACVICILITFLKIIVECYADAEWWWVF